MPRPSKSSTTISEPDPVAPRRSSRISSRQVQNVPTIPPAKRRKIMPPRESPMTGLQSCVTECSERPGMAATPSILSAHTMRRSSRMTFSELEEWEKFLSCKEQECKTRNQQLDERLQSLIDREDEAATQLSQVAKREAQNALSQLEEHFTCALCYEIMAYPYTLNPARCGHTFCAICILKWFFSRLHRVCGGWHEAVDCPICRSVLMITPDRVPRSGITFPFVPNRVASAVIESLIDKLAGSSLPVVKQEDPEALRISDADKEGRKQKRGGPKVEDGSLSSEADLDGWRQGGASRNEWLKRDSDGKREMNILVQSWSMLGSHEFLILKQRLEV